MKKNPNNRKPRTPEIVLCDTENRDAENTCFRVSDDAYDTDEYPPLASLIRTIPEAVNVALGEAVITQGTLFTFARALKAFEVTTGVTLKQEGAADAFGLLWQMSTSKGLLPKDACFDEWLYCFQYAFAKAKHPLGANVLDEAIRRADSKPHPPQTSHYTSPRIQRLIAVCFHLQDLAAGQPFFLSVRDAKKITQASNLFSSSAYLSGLVRDGILSEAVKGVPGGKKATRFFFNADPKKA